MSHSAFTMKTQEIVESEKKTVEAIEGVTMASLADNRPLYYAIMAMVVYLITGMVYYTQVSGWDVIQTIYFISITLTTVGFGDHPRFNDGEKVFTCVYVFVGMCLLGTALGIFAGAVLDKQEQMKADAEEKMKKQQAEEAARNEGTVAVQNTSSDDEEYVEPLLSDVNYKLLKSFVQCLLLLLIGTLSLASIEDWSFVDGLYFSCISTTSVGYGDIAPVTDGGKIFCVLYLLIGTLVVASALGDIANVPLEVRRRKMEAAVLAQYGDSLSEEELAEICEVGDDDVATKLEFAIGMLLKLNQLKQEDLDKCYKIFNKLDADGSGYLSKADIFASKEREDKLGNIFDGVDDIRNMTYEQRCATLLDLRKQWSTTNEQKMLLRGSSGVKEELRNLLRQQHKLGLRICELEDLLGLEPGAKVSAARDVPKTPAPLQDKSGSGEIDNKREPEKGVEEMQVPAPPKLEPGASKENEDRAVENP